MNLILTATHNLEDNQLKPFFHSLAKYIDHETTTLAVLTKDKAQIARLGWEGITVIDYKAEDSDLFAEWERYKYYEFFLIGHTNFENVLLTDIRDVYFQDNPFKNGFDEGKLQVAGEGRIFAENEWNKSNMIRMYGADQYNDYREYEIICSGTTMGTYNMVLGYCNQMIREMTKFKPEHADQIVHNSILYNHFPGIVWETNRNLFYTMGLMEDPQPYRHGWFGDAKSKPPIIHQYDRHFNYNYLCQVLRVYIIKLKRTDPLPYLDELKKLKIPLLVTLVDSITPMHKEFHDLKAYTGWMLPGGGKWWDRTVNPEEVACLASHIKAWGEFGALNSEIALFLEEDFKVLREWDIEESGWDLYYLGREKVDDNAVEQKVNDYVVQPSFSYNAHAYMLTQAAVTKLEQHYPISLIQKQAIPTDELLPAFYMIHPREDIAQMYQPIWNAFALVDDMIGQTSNEESSTTSLLRKEPMHIWEPVVADSKDGYHLTPEIMSKEYDLFTDEILSDVFCIPFWTPEQCERICDQAKIYEDWTTGRHTIYPTTDQLLDVFNPELGRWFKEMQKEFVYPWLAHLWDLEGDNWLTMQPENFIIEYTPGNQAYLSLHHDDSQTTTIVHLNEDYEGGGTYFSSKKSYIKGKTGLLTCHPGQVTHRHGARMVTKGVRYIIVSFLRKP